MLKNSSSNNNNIETCETETMKEKETSYTRFFARSLSFPEHWMDCFLLWPLFIRFDLQSLDVHTPSASDINLSMNRKNKLYRRSRIRTRKSERGKKEKDERMSEWCALASVSILLNEIAINFQVCARAFDRWQNHFVWNKVEEKKPQRKRIYESNQRIIAAECGIMWRHEEF